MKFSTIQRCPKNGKTIIGLSSATYVRNLQAPSFQSWNWRSITRGLLRGMYSKLSSTAILSMPIRTRRPDNILWKKFGETSYSMLRFAVHNTVADIVQTADYVSRLCRDELDGNPIPAFVAPSTPIANETGELHTARGAEPIHFNTPTVIDFLDQGRGNRFRCC